MTLYTLLSYPIISSQSTLKVQLRAYYWGRKSVTQPKRSQIVIELDGVKSSALSRRRGLSARDEHSITWESGVIM